MLSRMGEGQGCALLRPSARGPEPSVDALLSVTTQLQDPVRDALRLRGDRHAGGDDLLNLLDEGAQLQARAAVRPERAQAHPRRRSRAARLGRVRRRLDAGVQTQLPRDEPDMQDDRAVRAGWKGPLGREEESLRRSSRTMSFTNSCGLLSWISLAGEAPAASAASFQTMRGIPSRVLSEVTGSRCCPATSLRHSGPGLCRSASHRYSARSMLEP